MSNIGFTGLQKLKNGSRDHGSSCLHDSDSSSATGSDLADREHDLDDPGLGPGLTHLTPADIEKASKHGKKTKGRVKIKMEFINNKLRRYTTFSKRKTGIMKKAYELSTLTGTQVMLLVASETGHVYTFATRKLQPMITSESGKALIQTCLNSPDIPSDTHHHNPDQRMCATGFEETELSYQVSDDEGLNEGKSALFTVTNVPGAGADANVNTSTSSGLSLAGTGHTYPMTTYLPTSSTAQATAGAKINTSVAGALPMSVQQGASFATLISPTGQTLAAGQTLQAAAGLLQVQQGHSQLQIQANAHGQTPATPTLYRLPPGATVGTPNQMVTALVPSMPVASTSATTQHNANTVTMLTSPQSSMSRNANALATPLMYHTPQGVVYAASPAGTVNTLPEGIVFNYQHIHPTSQEGSSTAAVTGTVPTISVPLRLACQQPQLTNVTQASNLRITAVASLSSSKRSASTGETRPSTPAKVASLEAPNS